MKTFVLTISQQFPKTHKRSGEETGFVNAIQSQNKIHTIRGNFELWSKRAEKINKGEAILSVRVWEGKPYNSKQREVFVFEKIGIQKLYFEFNRLLEPFISSDDSENGTQTYLSTHEVAKNDGLTFPDFKEWFKGYDLNEPMGIIHFTNFKY